MRLKWPTLPSLAQKNFDTRTVFNFLCSLHSRVHPVRKHFLTATGVSAVWQLLKASP